MTRLVSWPSGLGITSFTPLNGPQAVGAGSSDSLGGYTQSVSGIGFLWEFALSFPSMNGKKARDFRGWIMAQNSGANATRYHLIDGDRPTNTSLGYNYERIDPVSWSGGYSWSGGERWLSGIPVVEMAASAARDDSLVNLPVSEWGRSIDVGTWIGFEPFHFGAYIITETLSDGWYRIYPPLRKDVASGDFVTLTPTLVMRMRGPQDASLPRGVSVIDEATINLVEVLDYDVRDYFTG